MTENDSWEVKWAKYIYLRLLNCDYYQNLSCCAYEYLEQHEDMAENDYLQDVADRDVGVAYEYYGRQPLCVIADKLKPTFANSEDGYDPMQSTLIEIAFSKMYGDTYNANKYHPVRFYCEFGIIPQLEDFEKIAGEEVGGWCNAWENPQIIMECYKKHLIGVIHPSREETNALLEENKSGEQMTIFDLMKGGQNGN